MGTLIAIVFLVALIVAVVGLFVPRRLFEIGIVVAVAALGLRVFLGI